MHARPEASVERVVRIALPTDDGMLATLRVPLGARGLVIFAHGSGSSRLSPRKRLVADVLDRAALATLVLDLLTGREENADRRTSQFLFDIELLAERLALATDAALHWRETATLPVTYFGASTGAAAALSRRRAGRARSPRSSRGAGVPISPATLSRVDAPTLLIVGGADTDVLEYNRAALQRLRNAEAELAVVAGATHLSEEPGALDEAARVARDWLARHLGPIGER
ncbi:DeoR family transcriptional regulator [Vulcanimicrobium alpinum]|uniref:DeoR family transcriptional regulator n=1 Tax=Vulcanimicrobium alpinum TaxID=3016050 RepID=A0AAN1XZA8_UNVUL|nr:hypothetical protein [Vulcanimicrobium alpinum]BDE07491.1 DeoR family transcriptional regulator [Vulcanimicrobium alpinum]